MSRRQRLSPIVRRVLRLLRSRETILLAGVAVTVVALGSIVARDLRQSARDAAELNARLSAGLDLIDELQFTTQEVRRILLYALYTSDANLQLRYADQSRAADALVEQRLDEPTALSTAAPVRERLNRVRDAWERYLLVRNEVIGLILEGSPHEGVALDEGDGASRFDAVRVALEDLRLSFEEDAAVQVRAVSTLAEQALRRLWILVISALVASAVGISLVNRRAALERVEAELRRARDAAEEAARAKTDFLAIVSHEFRTPLNAMIGIADLLDRTEMSPRQRELMRLSRSSASALLGLITDVLDYSRIEAESMTLVPVPFSLRGCVEAALDAVTEPAASKGLELGYLIDAAVPAGVIADEGRVRQVLLNLLSNAVKFTDRGEIAVDVGAEGHGEGAREIRVSVRDTGRGIPAHLHSLLFQRFSQVDATLSREQRGAGLGLAISDRLARLLGGSVTVESVPGAGSTFTFTFRAAVAPPSPEDAIDASSLRGLRALVLVPPGIVARQIHRLLSQWGLTTYSLTDHATAGPDHTAFDIVIADADARDRMLYDRAKALRAESPTRRMGLVFITQLRSTHVGHDDCQVVKPIRAHALSNALRASVALLPAAPLAPARPASAPPASALAILLVEDDEANRRIAHLMLEELGFEADHAASGVEALQRVRTRPYDVILMDLQMPGLDGLETTRRIRAEQPSRRTTILALTASVMQDEQARCRDAGMDGYLAKPLRLETLAETLRGVSTIGRS